MTYLAHPAHYTPDEFRTLVSGLKFDKGWRPKFPTLHNTGVPSLKQWLAMGAVPQERWGVNLNAYYKGLGWHAGPHVVCCTDYVWLLCDPEQDGVSVSCWNSETFGIEMVGNFEVDSDEFDGGPGANVRDNAVFVLASLCEKFGWEIADVLHFHRECARDHHACPGSLVSKPAIVERVHAQIEAWGRPSADGLSIRADSFRNRAVQPEADARSLSTPPLLDLDSVQGVQQALNAVGYRVDVDGVDGAETDQAIRSFQKQVGISVDGVVGPMTLAALRRELERQT
jgi:Putative peptidoglycan binding domain/N-acetylmuramoyl-L-alanine amidase